MRIGEIVESTRKLAERGYFCCPFCKSPVKPVDRSKWFGLKKWWDLHCPTHGYVKGRFPCKWKEK